MFFYQSDVQYLCDFNILYLFVNILPIILGNKVFVEINEFVLICWFVHLQITRTYIYIIFYISLAKISKKV